MVNGLLSEAEKPGIVSVLPSQGGGRGLPPD